MYTSVSEIKAKIESNFMKTWKRNDVSLSSLEGTADSQAKYQAERTTNSQAKYQAERCSWFWKLKSEVEWHQWFGSLAREAYPCGSTSE